MHSSSRLQTLNLQPKKWKEQDEYVDASSFIDIDMCPLN